MDINEYSAALNGHISSDQFGMMNPQQQQESIAGVRNWYLQQNPEADTEQVDRVTQGTNVHYLRNTGQGRALPIININLPSQEPGFNDLKKEEQLKKIEEYKLKVPEIAATAPTQKEDAEYFINQSVRELERKVNGQDTGYLADKGKRLLEGFAAGLASGVGAESAAQGIQDYFHENTKYDEDFSAQLAQGLGSAGSSVLIIAGAAAASGGLGATAATAEAIGVGASLASNGIMRYNEAYGKAIQNGLNADQAHDVGVSAMPAAVIDALSDKILASKVMPAKVNKVFATGSDAAKKEMFKTITANTALRGKLVNWAESAVTEGLSEAVGDYAAGLGPYLLTGEKNYLPTYKESINSFAIGAIIGGGLASAVDVPDLIGNKEGAPVTTVDANGNTVTTTPKYSTKSERDVAETEKMVPGLASNESSEVFKLLAEGRYKEARQLSDEYLNQPPAAPAAATPPTVAPTAPTTPGATVAPAATTAPNTTTAPVAPTATTTTTTSPTVAPTTAATSPLININDTQSTLDSYTFPTSVGKPKPRASGGVPIQFASDFDTMAYLLANDAKGQSKAAPKFIAEVAKLGLDLAHVKAHGRALIKAVQNTSPVPTPQGISYIAPKLQFNPPAAPKNKTTANAAQAAADAAAKVHQVFGNGSQNTEASTIATPAPNENQVTQTGGIPAVQSQPAVSETAVQTETGTTQQAGQGSQEVAPVLTKVEPLPTVPAISDNPTPEEQSQYEAKLNAVHEWESNYSKTHDSITGEPLTQEAPAQAGSELNTQGIPAPATIPATAQVGTHSIGEFMNHVRSIIPTNKIPAFTRMMADALVKNPNLRFTFERASNYPIEAAGLYDGNKNLIYISKLDYRTIAHETAHALTQHDIKKYAGFRKGATYAASLRKALLDPKVPEHIKTLIDVYLKTAKELGHEGMIGRVVNESNLSLFGVLDPAAYSFTSLDEFVAEAMSMEKFQEQLSTIMYNGKTLWQHIVEAISNAMGWMQDIAQNNSADLIARSNNNNALVATLAAANQIIQSDVRAGEKSNINYLPVTPEENAAYMQAAKNPVENTEHLQEMVNEAANNTGPNVGPVFHWSRSQERFSVFDITKGTEAFHFGTKRSSEERAKDFEGVDGTTFGVYLFGKEIPIKDMSTNDATSIVMQIDKDNKIRENDVSLFSIVTAAEYKRRLNIDHEVPQVRKEQTGGFGVYLDAVRVGFFLDENKALKAAKATNPNLSLSLRNEFEQTVERTERRLGRRLLHPMQELAQKIDSDVVFSYTNDSEDRGSKSYIVLHPQQIKSADPVTYDALGNVVPLNERFNSEESNINYLPAQTRAQKVANGFRRMDEITKGKINDKVDTMTQRITSLLKGIKPSEIFRLSNDIQDYFFELVDNIYEARKTAVQNPAMRIDSDEMITRLMAVSEAINAERIKDMLSDYDELIDFDSLNINLNDRTAIQAVINKYVEDNGIHDLARRQNQSASAKARVEALYQKYRDTYHAIREQVKNRFVDKDNYIKEIEAMWSGSLDDHQYLKSFLGMHYDYLMTLDTSTVEGQELYKHFYAVNNMLDGNFRYMDMTAKHIGKLMDAQQNIKGLTGQFRDPVSDKGPWIRTLSWLNQKAELHQVQLQRLSAFRSARQFIQEQLLGDFYRGLTQDAENLKKKNTDEYVKFRDELLGGKESTAEDKAVCAIMGRLIQRGTDEDPDAALLKNIKKEYQSLNNAINGATTANMRQHYNLVIRPLLDGITKGLLDYGEGSMIHFMDTFSERARGTQTIQRGDIRKQLVDKTQEIFSRYTLASRILSEGFHGVTFNQQVSYIPNDVTSVKYGDTKDQDITDDSRPEDFNNSQGLTAQQFFYKERQTELGDDGAYSYNNESTLKRNVEKLSVDHLTLPQRFVIKSRLAKGGELNKIITQTKSNTFHQQRIQYLNSLINQVRHNATSAGVPQNVLVSTLSKANRVYSRGVLSSIHHIITQPVATLADYALRTGDLKGWMDAAAYYAGNYGKVNKWLADNSRWTADREALDVASLDNRRTSMDPGEVASMPLVKWMGNFYEKAGDIMTLSLRLGDNFAAKVTLLAEYQRLRKEKGYRFADIGSIDFDVTEGNLMAQATLNSERISNTSNKAFRSDLFSDRNMSTTFIRNMLFAFASHSANLASQLNMACRDLMDLRGMDAPEGERASKVRTIGAIMAQQVVFTSARFAIGAMAGKAIIALAQDLFDDDDGKIEELETKVQIARARKDKVKIAHAENELANAKTVRSLITKMDQNTSTDAWFKSVIRDASGSVWMGMNNTSIQHIAFMVPDTFARAMAQEGQKKMEAQIAADINIARERKDLKKVARLTEQQTIINAAEYIPFDYSSTQGFGAPGVYGSVLDSYYRQLTEAQGVFSGTKEWSFNDFMVAAATAGLGQAEFTKAMNQIDKIEDATWQRNKKFEEETLPAAEEAKKHPKARGFDFAGF